MGLSKHSSPLGHSTLLDGPTVSGVYGKDSDWETYSRVYYFACTVLVILAFAFASTR